MAIGTMDLSRDAVRIASPSPSRRDRVSVFRESGLWSRFLMAVSLHDRMLYDGGQMPSDDAGEILDVATCFVELVARANDL
jgi:hypothetical protein